MSNDAQTDSENVHGVIKSAIHKWASYIVLAYVCIINADDITAFVADIHLNMVNMFQASNMYLSDLWDQYMISPPMGMEMSTSVYRRPIRDYFTLVFVIVVVHLILLKALAHHGRVYVQAPVQADDQPTPTRRSRGRPKTPRTVRANRKRPPLLQEEIEPRSDFERKIHKWGFKIIKKKSSAGRRTTVRFVSPEGEEFGGKVAVRQYILQVPDLK